MTSILGGRKRDASSSSSQPAPGKFSEAAVNTTRSVTDSGAPTCDRMPAKIGAFSAPSRPSKQAGPTPEDYATRLARLDCRTEADAVWNVKDLDSLAYRKFPVFGKPSGQKSNAIEHVTAEGDFALDRPRPPGRAVEVLSAVNRTFEYAGFRQDGRAAGGWRAKGSETQTSDAASITTSAYSANPNMSTVPQDGQQCPRFMPPPELFEDWDSDWILRQEKLQVQNTTLAVQNTMPALLSQAGLRHKDTTENMVPADREGHIPAPSLLFESLFEGL